MLSRSSAGSFELIEELGDRGGSEVGGVVAEFSLATKRTILPSAVMGVTSLRSSWRPSAALSSSAAVCRRLERLL